MPDPVAIRVADGVAVITLDNPPVNALSAPVRSGLAAALAEASVDTAVRVIVLAAVGRSWPVGADIHEFGQAPVGPDLPEICAAIADCPKPVIAALHGSALGGGLELALVADFRMAASGTSLGFPEVSLGLLPGAGGTQRLPRLIGAKPALGMMLSGLPIAAERGVELGLIDEVVAGDVTVAAQELAQKLATGLRRLRPGPRPNRLREDPGLCLEAVADARKGLAGPRLP
ncbi:MAG: enoyl-CoA hydratase/isomerase family protein, partial [Albidovulum sp.]